MAEHRPRSFNVGIPTTRKQHSRRACRYQTDVTDEEWHLIDRERSGREASPTDAIIDSQSICRAKLPRPTGRGPGSPADATGRDPRRFRAHPACLARFATEQSIQKLPCRRRNAFLAEQRTKLRLHIP